MSQKRDLSGGCGKRGFAAGKLISGIIFLIFQLDATAHDALALWVPRFGQILALTTHWLER